MDPDPVRIKNFLVWLNRDKKRKKTEFLILYIKVVINVQMQPNDVNLLVLEIYN